MGWAGFVWGGFIPIPGRLHLVLVLLHGAALLCTAWETLGTASAVRWGEVFWCVMMVLAQSAGMEPAALDS